MIQYSGKINIGGGDIHGCPLSPLLFTIVIEMCLVIRQCSRIHGVSIGQQEHKMILYADDVTFFLQQPITESIVIRLINKNQY